MSGGDAGGDVAGKNRSACHPTHIQYADHCTLEAGYDPTHEAALQQNSAAQVPGDDMSGEPFGSQPNEEGMDSYHDNNGFAAAPQVSVYG